MTQLAHAPKFGNWDGENIPYTTYFEMVRRDKGAGSKILNPNDPEENPQAYHPGTFARDHKRCQKHHNDTSTGYHVVKQHHRKHNSREDGEFQRYMEAPLPHRSTFQRVNMGPQRSRNRGSRLSVPSSDKNNSDNSLLQPRHRRRTDKDSAEGSHGFSPLPLHEAIPEAGNSLEGKAPQRRAPSVPRFGSWDETDPKSAESFTVIFNKVKEEKQIAATKLPTLPAKTMTYPERQNNSSHASSKSKMCCCLFPTAAE
ncbi:NOI-like protein isoform X2 [Phoenix dactylifera]|uniref:NOI-like protein isoform X2 n=1 Tax=Phoenix dactylifera TaxID=42345 RepID=A0A8B7MVV2_PHODC|nr:NOI-like protein isoform X2 [Phoenix dactylifera]